MVEIKSLIDALSSNTLNEQGLFKCLEKYRSYTSDTNMVSQHREDFALVYTLLIKKFTEFFYNDNTKKVDDKYVNYLLNCFENIKNIVLNNEQNEETSDLQVIYLLKILREDTVESDDRERIYKYAEKLLDNLSGLEFIFDIKDEKNEYYFPLSNIIQHVIESYFFDNQENESIKPSNIHLLQMAVRLFEKNENINPVLDRLKNKCNLLFIDYLKNTCTLLDDKELHNYHENRVMVFINNNSNKVLIRNDKKEYFNNAKSIQEEKNSKGKTIGYFVEKELGKGDVRSFDELIDEEENRIPLLKLLFDSNHKNIFLEKSLLRTNKEIIPINSYCNNDKSIIIPNSNGYACYDTLPKSNPRYNAYTIQNKDSDNPFDRVTFGFCCFLLSQKNIGTEQLFVNGNDQGWYQNRILSNWINSPEVKISDIKVLHNMIVNELRDYTDSKKLSNKKINSQLFLPLSGNIVNDTINKIKNTKAIDYEIIIANVKRKRFSDEITFSINTESISQDEIKTLDGDNFDFEKIIQDQVYLVRDCTNHEYLIMDQQPLISYYSTQEIQKNCLPYDAFKDNHKVFFNNLSEKMKLFNEGFSDSTITQDYPCLKNLEEQYYIRILNNLVWVGINKLTQVNSYSNIIKKHQVISFEKSKEKVKEFLKKQDDGVFIIPKDQYYSDSVLFNAYNKYYKSTSSRDSYCLFDNTVRKKGNKYFHRNSEIKQIAFITDNALVGTSTNNGLNARFDAETTDITDSEGKKVTITDIMSTNSINKLEVYCIFGTEKAKEKIKENLEKKGIDCEIIIENKLNDKSIKHKLIISKDMNQFNSQKDKQEFIPVFREFNMTKKCIFPDQMLDDPQKAICLFIRKKELPKKEI